MYSMYGNLTLCKGKPKLGYTDYQLLIIIKATKARIRTYMQDKESRL